VSGSPVYSPGEAVAACPWYVCPVLQSGQTTSRHQATDSRTVWGAWSSTSRGCQDPPLASPGWTAPRLPQKCLIAERCTNKRRVPGGEGQCIWEVADHQFLSRISQLTTSKASRFLLGRTLPASKHWPLYGPAFLPEEAAKQERPEDIRPSLFREMTHESSARGTFLRDVLETFPIFLNGCPK